MKLVLFSDTHRKHQKVQLGSGDLLIHCGDFTSRGDLKDVEDFASYMKKQDFGCKIVIAGNHDFCFEDERKVEAEKLLLDAGLIYLNDSGIEFSGFNIWGSPIQPYFHNWAFNRQRGEEIDRHWQMIPTDTDILITHGPPAGILDRCISGERVGCADLLKKVEAIRPKIHAFGHIHEDYGQLLKDGTLFVNACSLDLKYRVRNEPVVIEI
jgi:Icc-related predicted phosphoesterase